MKIGIVSLSSGIIGESFVNHEINIGINRLKEYGFDLLFLDNALKGLDFISEHPELRAQDLINAYKDSNIDVILCAIGGEDTYRLLPYLFDNDELKSVINDKIFLGFSDTTINHLMLYKLGKKSFYGQSFFSDVCELDKEMLPYTKKYFEELLFTKKIDEIKPSNVWYEERKSYAIDQIGVPRIKHKNKGFELLQGNSCFEGKILGGCIESLYDYLINSDYKKYNLFPNLNEWKGKILLLESSETQSCPQLIHVMLNTIKSTGIFNVINGIIVGKPMDEKYYEEYKEVLISCIDNQDLPILYNVNIGHSTPRCIIPFGVDCVVDFNKQIIKFRN